MSPRLVKTLASLLASALAAGAATNYAAWTGHRAITLNTSAAGANVANNVTNFPVLIRLGANESAILAAANNGASIRFSKTDSTTALPYQIESWSSTGAVLWVKVDTVKGNNATQKILLHYGNSAAASESSGPAVFDTANGFRGVWHLQDSTGGVSKDATVLNTNAAWNNAPVLANGLIGRAVDFSNPNLAPENAKYLRADYNLTNNNFKVNSTNGLTLSAWVRRSNNNGGNEQGILGRYNWGQNARQAMIALNGTDQIRLFRSINGTNATGQEANFGNTSITDGDWFHIVATLKNGSQILYVNGVQDVAQTTATIGSLDSVWAATSALAIGRMAPDHTGNPVAQAFTGIIDEARFTGTVRSADWIKLEYENQKGLNTLVDIGAPVAPGAPTGVTTVAGSAGTGAVTVSWLAPASDGGTTITNYKAMAVSDTNKYCNSGNTLTCLVTGLTTGQAYTFYVRAGNAIGYGPTSVASATVTPPVSLIPGARAFQVGRFTKAYTFQLPEAASRVVGELTMTISDASGKTVWSRTIQPSQNAGRTITWNGLTAQGAKASAGMYIARIHGSDAAGIQNVVQAGVKLLQD